MNNKFKTLDVVALLNDIPEKKLLKGQVGTIVENIDTGAFEVEFCNKKGETLVTLPLKENEILLLHYENEFV